MEQLENNEPVIHVQGLSKDYYLGQTIVPALRDVGLEILPGEMVAVMGPSGSGKSTLMNLLGCLDRPTDGFYWLDGVEVSEMSLDELADVRNQKVGFVFQSFNLLPNITALDNVELPLMYTNIPADERQERALEALDLVGLYSRCYHRPVELSGGQQQRVAIARALVTGPSLILADEPTGNLDSYTSIEIMAILQRLNADGITVVLVTHEADIANYCQRIIQFRDGSVVSDTVNSKQVFAQDKLAARLSEAALAETEVHQ
ncbi:MAG TPA: ABC transporter ATP-binding protein [Ktedonobacteraceae bacterium]|jgi:putative ABC transport system ATP-binding protein